MVNRGVILALAMPLVASPKLASPKLPSLNEKIVAYCEARVGQKVGTGQCADLAQQALLSFGAADRYRRAPDAPNPGDYVWGRRVATVVPDRQDTAAILPGDVLQYRDVVFERRTRFSWSQSTAAHHTSIVAEVCPGTLRVYEQNVNGRMTVGKTELALDDLKSGTLWVYRAAPVPLRTPARR
ncbi:CHAP domain-containing protein [bacterium]|nr:MAG: CHAP domain-containing protein [bacterium]